MVFLNLKVNKKGELDLSSYGLKDIPKEITSMHTIRDLNLSNNKIASVGKIIGNLPHLNKLDLSQNCIKGLPETIGNLTNLEYLNLSSNQLATLPATFGKLKNLKYLNLKNNPLSAKFQDIVGPCHNELQCQQAAKNILKSFSSQSDWDKKKKSSTEQDWKKKKTQNGGINQQKQKDRKQKKSTKGGFSSFLWNFIKYIFYLLLIVLVLIYALSFYDQPRFSGLISQIHPHYHRLLTRAGLTEEQTTKVEAVIVQANKMLNNTVIVCYQAAVTGAKNVHKYVTTDETLHGYIDYVKVTVSELFNGSKKQKS